MQRLLLAGFGVVVVGVVVLLVVFDPQSRPAPPPPRAPLVVLADAAPRTFPPRQVRRWRLDAAIEAPGVVPGVVLEGDAAIAPPKGPFKVDLGQHTIHLNDPEQKRVLEVRIELTTPTATSRRLIYLQRRKLLRMLFFLGSKRRAEGALGPGGQARFKRDLLERFRNVLGAANLTAMDFPRYRVVPFEPSP